MQVIVAGAGPGAVEFYTEKMKTAVAAADVVITSERLAEPMRELNDNVVVAGVMHLWSNVRFAENFVERCRNYGGGGKWK